MCPTNQFRNTDISCPGPLQDLKLIKVSVVSGVAVVTFDNPHSKVNSFSFDFLIEIWKVLSYFEDHASEFVGMAILSAKPDNYFAGADVKMLYDCDRKMALHVSKSGQQTVKRLAMLPFPTVAAVMGPCLGGGLEMVLSTKYVLAVDTPKTVFGVPEVMIGLIPAGGGCNFLPRKINVIEAISMIATGKKVGAGKAHSLGLVDELVEARFDDADTLQCLEMRAIECVMELSEGSLQYGRLSVYNHLLLKSMSVKIIRDYVMNRARQDILDKSHGYYPSPLAAIDVIEKSLSEGIEVGLEYEQLRFADVAETPQSRSLIRLFDGQTSFKKNKFDVTIEPFKNVIIVGSEQDTLARYILESYESKFPNVIFVTTDVLSSTDIPSGQILVIDTTLDHNSAVSAIESRFCNSDYLIIKITDRKTLHQVCQESSAPDKLLVGRYFRPHEKSQFVELTQSPHVCSKKMAAVSEAILNSGKSVLVVRDKAGLFMTRIFAMFAFEGMRLLLEGLNLEDLETLTRKMGFTFGILTMMDLIGIDVLVDFFDEVSQTDKYLLEYDIRVLRKLGQNGCTGLSGGQGWYMYEDGKKTQINHKARDILQCHVKDSQDEDMIFSDSNEQRLLLRFVNECLKCYQDKTISSMLEADTACVLGLGFPPYLGGPFRYCESLGMKNVFEKLSYLQLLFGSRFEPCEFLDIELTTSRQTAPPMNKL